MDRTLAGVVDRKMEMAMDSGRGEGGKKRGMGCTFWWKRVSSGRWTDDLVLAARREELRRRRKRDGAVGKSRRGNLEVRSHKLGAAQGPRQRESSSNGQF